MIEMIDIYLAAALFSDWERKRNSEITALLEREWSVFLPQRDGCLLDELLASGVDSTLAARQVYEKDTCALQSCRVIVAILDGPVIDEGLLVEVGMAVAFGKAVVAYSTDWRLFAIERGREGWGYPRGVEVSG